MNQETVDHEVSLLQVEVTKLGTRDAANGKISVPFGVLFQHTQDIFEALGGTLKAAKKRGIVSYDAPILLKGAVRSIFTFNSLCSLLRLLERLSPYPRIPLSYSLSHSHKNSTTKLQSFY